MCSPDFPKKTKPGAARVRALLQEKISKADAATESIKSQRDALERLCHRCRDGDDGNVTKHQSECGTDVPMYFQVATAVRISFHLPHLPLQKPIL